MSRSLAVVGILTITGVTGVWSAIGQDDTTQTSQGVVVKNHMSDAERDRLMEEAMADARRRLNEEKSKEEAAIKKAAAEQTKSDEKAKEAAAETEAAEKKAKEERLAKQLAEQEKASSNKDTVKMELAPLKKEDVEKESAAEKASESAKKAVAETSKKATAETKSDSKPEPKKVTASSRDKEDEKESRSKATKAESKKAEPEDEKVVVETVSTNDPGAGLTVKTSMPVGDDARRAEQQAALADRDDERSSDRRDNSGDRQTVTGRVVGMMRSTSDSPRILVQGDDRRMVQVVLDRDQSMPAPGAYVTVKGRTIGGSGNSQVLSASSVDIKSGSTVRTQTSVSRPAPVPAVPAVIPPPPPMAMMPPPLPIGPGPMMFPPPPPF